MLTVLFGILLMFGVYSRKSYVFSNMVGVYCMKSYLSSYVVGVYCTKSYPSSNMVGVGVVFLPSARSSFFEYFNQNVPMADQGLTPTANYLSFQFAN